MQQSLKHLVAPCSVLFRTALVALAGLVSVHSASALTWTNVACAGGTECPKVGVPTGPCSCGFYLDSPGSLASDPETVFTFVKSGGNGEGLALDETAKWNAVAPAADFSPYNNMEVRAAVNDNAFLKVILYRNLGGADFNNCAETSPDIITTIMYGGGSKAGDPGDDDSIFRVKSAAVAIGVNEPIGLCIILSDDSDNVVPVVMRSSALVDYVRLKSNNGSATLENFARGL